MARKRKVCYSGIGGQAVLEGVMMKNGEKYAVAVRKPNQEIEIEIENYQSLSDRVGVAKIPFVRGIFNFIDSLVLGMRALNYSASFYDEESEREEFRGETTEENAGKEDKVVVSHKAASGLQPDAKEKVANFITMAISFCLAIGLFVLLPTYVASIFEGKIRNQSLIAIIEGVIRIAVFLLYLIVISALKDIRRLYQYHGAEHKCINCIERGRALTVGNVMHSSRFHRRCGTSFLFFVVFISILLFFFIRVDNLGLRFLIRILLIPVIAGISYEVLRLAGRKDNFLIRAVSAPGLWIQRLTTREPDKAMIQVAIASVEAVFDWKQYLKDTFEYDVDSEYADADDDEGMDQ